MSHKSKGGFKTTQLPEEAFIEWRNKNLDYLKSKYDDLVEWHLKWTPHIGEDRIKMVICNLHNQAVLAYKKQFNIPLSEKDQLYLNYLESAMKEIQRAPMEVRLNLTPEDQKILNKETEDRAVIGAKIDIWTPDFSQTEKLIQDLEKAQEEIDLMKMKKPEHDTEIGVKEYEQDRLLKDKELLKTLDELSEETDKLIKIDEEAILDNIEIYKNVMEKMEKSEKAKKREELKEKFEMLYKYFQQNT